ncbi:cysteine-rich receptor-like protein kinase 8 [Tanacetum coccineum]|uniref:Cysteine-rich receptor-like protein kinase 8 n=1 Tax=Tanacetum coccineum TaxID=301880 RepID=A0ABQ5ADS5_9ASTR
MAVGNTNQNNRNSNQHNTNNNETFNPNNYSTWKRSMMIALNARNKYKIVTGLKITIKGLMVLDKKEGVPLDQDIPLHGKYKPPVVKTISTPKVINSVMGQGHNPNTPSTSQAGPSNDNDVVFVRMDQLQNQLNQVLLMMQNVQKNPPTDPQQEDCSRYPV